MGSEEPSQNKQTTKPNRQGITTNLCSEPSSSFQPRLKPELAPLFAGFTCPTLSSPLAHGQLVLPRAFPRAPGMKTSQVCFTLEVFVWNVLPHVSTRLPYPSLLHSPASVGAHAQTSPSLSSSLGCCQHEPRSPTYIIF